jgi:hypothetical protein
MNTIRLEELSWHEFASRIGAGAPVFLLLGSTEQHGQTFWPTRTTPISTLRRA